MDTDFNKKIENLFKNKQFENIKFEINLLEDHEKEDPFLYNILGIIEANQKNFDKAKFFFYSALKQDRDYLHSLINLSNISYIDRDFQKIISLLKEYDLRNPENLKVTSTLADLCYSAGFVEETIYFHKKLIKSEKFENKDLTALIFLLNYSSKYSENEYKKYCKLYDEILTKNKTFYNLVNSENDRAKIGFLSYDLRDHSVGYFLKDLVKKLNKQNFKTIAFNLYEDKIDNPFMSNLKSSFSEWYNVSNLDDKELSDYIYSKKVYFLIDLAGYSNGNRLQVFKNKPAPVQFSWLGYCNETYIEEIDFMIADENVIEKNDNKRFVRMPKIWNSLSKLDSIEINELPVIKNNFFNFGCFNNFLKISDETIEVWGEILSKFTNSNLILKNSLISDKNFKNYLLKKFKTKISENRIIVLNYEKDKKSHLKQYYNIDLGLDTFPYNGVTTTFESLWMGVPVITLKGQRFISRCGYSINKNAQLMDFIAKNKDEYIRTALEFNTDDGVKKLKNLRKSLRPNIINSPLFDTSSFSESFLDKLNKYRKK